MDSSAQGYGLPTNESAEYGDPQALASTAHTDLMSSAQDHNLDLDRVSAIDPDLLQQNHTQLLDEEAYAFGSFQGGQNNPHLNSNSTSFGPPYYSNTTSLGSMGFYNTTTPGSNLQGIGYSYDTHQFGGTFMPAAQAHYQGYVPTDNTAVQPLVNTGLLGFNGQAWSAERASGFGYPQGQPQAPFSAPISAGHDATSELPNQFVGSNELPLSQEEVGLAISDTVPAPIEEEEVYDYAYDSDNLIRQQLNEEPMPKSKKVTKRQRGTGTPRKARAKSAAKSDVVTQQDNESRPTTAQTPLDGGFGAWSGHLTGARSATEVLNQVRHVDGTGAREISGDDWNDIEQSAGLKLQYAEALYESMRVLPDDSSEYMRKQWEHLLTRRYTQPELEANAVILVEKAIKFHRYKAGITFDPRQYVEETKERKWTCSVRIQNMIKFLKVSGGLNDQFLYAILTV